MFELYESQKLINFHCILKCQHYIRTGVYFAQRDSKSYLMTIKDLNVLLVDYKIIKPHSVYRSRMLGSWVSTYTEKKT